MFLVPFLWRVFLALFVSLTDMFYIFHPLGRCISLSVDFYFLFPTVSVPSSISFS